MKSCSRKVSLTGIYSLEVYHADISLLGSDDLVLGGEGKKKKNVQDVRQISNRKTLELIETAKWRSVWQSQNKRRILKMSKY